MTAHFLDIWVNFYIIAKNYAFYKLFQSNTKLINAKKLSLPATTLINGCYSYMFNGCTSLVTAPELPATTLASNCYNSMFSGCTSISEAPGLPATTLAQSCYSGMFNGCTSLTTAPSVLPAKKMSDYCYYGMFYDCTSLTTAPELPATTLAKRCYANMFQNCTSLTTAPSVLPAKILTDDCYDCMFRNCTSLVEAPELPAHKCSNYGYSGMFEGCSNLSYIKCMLMTQGSPVETGNWVLGVSETGVFVKNVLSPLDEYIVHGIPRGWTIVNVEEEGNFDETFHATPSGYLTFTATKDNSYIGLRKRGTNHMLKISKDGSQWINLNFNGLCYKANSNEKFYVCGDLTSNQSVSDYSTFYMNGEFSVSGNINSIWDGSNLTSTTLYAYCGYKLFSECAALISISDIVLPATTLAKGCYQSMFYGCTRITSTPELPATILAVSCYRTMFSGCKSLTTVLGILATELADWCCSNMFQGCTSLTEAPELLATTLAYYCYNGMFQGCTSLTETPELPATTLAESCYGGMFSDCTNLTTAPELSATTMVQSCYNSMFSGCTSLTEAPKLPATTLASHCYSYMFRNCTNLNHIKAMFTTKPTTAYTYNWVSNVASSGTFVKNSAATWNVRGVNGIPNGWTVQTAST